MAARLSRPAVRLLVALLGELISNYHSIASFMLQQRYHKRGELSIEKSYESQLNAGNSCHSSSSNFRSSLSGSSHITSVCEPQLEHSTISPCTVSLVRGIGAAHLGQVRKSLIIQSPFAMIWDKNKNRRSWWGLERRCTYLAGRLRETNADYPDPESGLVLVSVSVSRVYAWNV